MSNIKQRMLEVLEETVNYYSRDTSRRCIEDNTCFYYKEGNMCAVGRCLVDPQSLEISIGAGDNDIVSLVKEEVEVEFKDEYKGLPLSFWEDLQCLHDATSNWGTTQYSKDLLKSAISNIKAKIADSTYEKSQLLWLDRDWETLKVFPERQR